jgi:hypothetical protein
MFAGLANTGAEVLDIRSRAMQAWLDAENARDDLEAAALDVAELVLQEIVQAGLAAAQDALQKGAITTFGPLGLPLVGMLHVTFGLMDGAVDERLGTDPVDLTDGLGDVAAEFSSKAGLLRTAAETVEELAPVTKVLNDAMGDFDAFVGRLGPLQEELTVAVELLVAAKVYQDAMEVLTASYAEVETLYQETLPRNLEAIESIPDLVEQAKEEAAVAAIRIDDLSNLYDDLYAAPDY